MDAKLVELAQGTSILILVLVEASEFDVLLTAVSMWKERKGVIKSTDFHNLQLTFHFVVVAVLFEPLFEVVDLGGLK